MGNTTDSNCSGPEWIEKSLGYCASTWQEQVSAAVYLLSFFIWLLVLLPQLLKNARDLKCVEGLSKRFIASWIVGDITNLVHASYSFAKSNNRIALPAGLCFLVIDAVLVVQCLYFHRMRQKRITGQHETRSLPSQIVLCLTGFMLFSITGGLHLSKSLFASMPSDYIINNRKGRQLMSVPHISGFLQTGIDIPEFVGGVICGIFYSVARLCQLRKNYRRKSTDGLSAMMFILCIIGNVSIITAMLFRFSDTDFIISSIPWTAFSAILMCLDCLILLQFRYYGERDFDTLSREPLPEECYNAIN